MYNVSSDYKSQINNKLRNPIKTLITFNAVDPQAAGSSTISSNGEQTYSESNQIDVLSYLYQYPYGRVYDNGFILDGNSQPIPDNVIDYSYQGYVSTNISDSAGVFQTLPTLTVLFSEYVSLAGLTIEFDTIDGNYPTEMSVYSYADGELLTTDTAEITGTTFRYERGIPMDGSNTNKIIIEFTKTNFPYRDVRVSSLLFGLVKLFTNDNITEYTVKRDIDLINSALPTESFSFTFIDFNKEFDPDNTSGLWKYLEEEQQITASCGYELDNGEVEWVPLGTYYTQGDATISDNSIPLITLTSISLLTYLTDDYTKGVYYPDGINGFDLATAVMEDLDLPLNDDGSKKWEFNEEQMSKYMFYAPLDVQSHAVCLQVIASACMCLLYTNRDGNIVIGLKDYDYIENSDFRYSFDSIQAPPKVTKYPILKSIIVTYQSVTPDTDTKELDSIDIDSTDAAEYILSYDAATSISISADSNVTIVGEPQIYGARAIVTAYGTGTITATGNELVVSDKIYTKTYSNTGDDCPVELSTISTEAQAADYAEYVYNYIKLRTLYEISDRGYPEIDPLDTVFAQSSHAGYNGVIVTSSELTFDGDLSGTTRYYKLVDYSQYIDNTIVTTTSETDYSTVYNTILPDFTVTDNYGRIYDNGWVLNSNSKVLPSANPSAQAYISSSISGSDKSFVVAPEIQIEFIRPILSQGLTITFADNENYPTDVSLITYNDNTLISEISVTNNDSASLVYTGFVPDTSSMDKLVIRFNKTNRPYRDIRVNNIYFGIR